MGRKDRERIERLQSGKEKPFRNENRLMDTGVKVLQALSKDKQVDVLNEYIGTGKLSKGKLRETLEDKAPHEMRKGIRKLKKKNRPVTVDNLLEEYRKDKPFQQLANSVGLDEKWFINLALEEIANEKTGY